jgi:hypothetical protein
MKVLLVIFCIVLFVLFFTCPEKTEKAMDDFLQKQAQKTEQND